MPHCQGKRESRTYTSLLVYTCARQSRTGYLPQIEVQSEDDLRVHVYARGAMSGTRSLGELTQIDSFFPLGAGCILGP
jgi:hypothetical protein